MRVKIYHQSTPKINEQIEEPLEMTWSKGLGGER